MQTWTNKPRPTIHAATTRQVHSHQIIRRLDIDQTRPTILSETEIGGIERQTPATTAMRVLTRRILCRPSSVHDFERPATPPMPSRLLVPHRTIPATMTVVMHVRIIRTLDRHKTDRTIRRPTQWPISPFPATATTATTLPPSSLTTVPSTRTRR